MPPISLTKLLFVLSFVCASLMPQMGALGDNWYDCESNDPDLNVQGCTRIIQQNSSQDTPKDIGRAYFKRGKAYTDKKLYDLAIADFDRASRRNPADTEAIKARADAIRMRGIRTAQATVAPSCPAGYVFSGGQCVRSAVPAPTCPAGYIFSGGQCVVGTAATPPIRTAPVRPAPTVNLALELQTQLKRIGCLTGQVDGVWGDSSRTALARFASQAGLGLGREPSQQAIDEARNTAVRYCQSVRQAKPTRKPRRKKRRVSGSNDFADLDCNDLWYARNGLFAEYGLCFKTARGRKAFHNVNYPNVCSPPFGKLPASAKSDVAQIKRVERQKSCG